MFDQIGEGKKETSQGTIDDQIIAIFKQHPRGIKSKGKLEALCKEEYGKGFGLSGTYAETPLRRLVDKGIITKDSEGYYLTENDDQQTFKQPIDDSRRRHD